MISIRRENPAADLPGIRRVVERAFTEPVGTGSHDALRGRDDVLSLVAVDDEDRIVANAMFTPVTLEAEDGALPGMGLLLLAVDPDYQRQGIGRRLMDRGLGMLRDDDCPFVIVVGVSTYYPRLGFRRGSSLGFRCQWNVRDESFMAIVLDETAVGGRTGVTRYDDFR